MKSKKPAETVKIGPLHKYLGRFRKAEFLNQGHNFVKSMMGMSNPSGSKSGGGQSWAEKWREDYLKAGSHLPHENKDE